MIWQHELKYESQRKNENNNYLSRTHSQHHVLYLRPISIEIGPLHITYNEVYIVLHDVLECYTSDTNVQGYPFLFPFAAYFHKTASKIDTIQLQ